LKLGLSYNAALDALKVPTKSSVYPSEGARKLRD
jgi:hypothetical protein